MNKFRLFVENFLAPETTKHMRFQPPVVENSDYSRLEAQRVVADLATKLAMAGTVEFRPDITEPQA